MKNQKVFIVYGSPLSGKTTYIKQVAKKGDLIVDIDDIWQILSGCVRYEKPQELNDIVLKVNKLILDSIKERKGKWNNAYISCSESFKPILNKLKDNLNATLIHIDTDKETCLKRLYENGDGRDIATWKRYINNYFRFADKGE